jgi:hypothetical protein
VEERTFPIFNTPGKWEVQASPDIGKSKRVAIGSLPQICNLQGYNCRLAS